MKLPLSPIMRRILADPVASKQLQKALVDRDTRIELDGKIYKITSAQF
jgi:hypothetical protein